MARLGKAWQGMYNTFKYLIISNNTMKQRICNKCKCLIPPGENYYKIFKVIIINKSKPLKFGPLKTDGDLCLSCWEDIKKRWMKED